MIPYALFLCGIRFHFRRNLINYYFACVCILFGGIHRLSSTEIFNINHDTTREDGWIGTDIRNIGVAVSQNHIPAKLNDYTVKSF